MAQGRKHWIQAMLGEDSYTPFPYFYDVTAWSLPLLANVPGGSSGAVLRPRAVPVRTLPAPRPGHGGEAPKLGVLQLSATSSAARQSAGWLRHRLDRDWRLPFTLLTPADVAAGRLAGVEVLVTPDGPASSAYDALGDAGRSALQEWTRDGGRYIGWQGGTQLAARLGLTTATLSEPTSDIPGSLFRAKVDEDGPLAAGVGSASAMWWTTRVACRRTTTRSPPDCRPSSRRPASPRWPSPSSDPSTCACCCYPACHNNNTPQVNRCSGGAVSERSGAAPLTCVDVG
ncbi:hypothetical protein E1281_32195 [Actinomadura sp. KC345]|uniref:hypothetical protein n=1 Tax=Actinomadura sp. KC345 TaxID=2530371 RepID=UPI00104D8232|nr:hypothetical protein [Actinomadura sp. KC345]TDC44906.1 hypothetical protein E1281_32195 [Actinomadura sp. KC345]